jgi:HTH-type transcriptional regulator/antitoxin HigA
MTSVIDFQRLLPAWQTLQSVAPIAHIESESDYDDATTLLNSLLDLVRDDARHPLYSLVAVIGDLIEAYEIDREPRQHGICYGAESKTMRASP